MCGSNSCIIIILLLLCCGGNSNSSSVNGQCCSSDLMEGLVLGLLLSNCCGASNSCG